MDAELRQIANGFDFKVHTYEKYDINGYRFRTGMKEQTMPDRKTTNSGVSAIDGGVEYYGIVEEIYELLYYGENPPNAVVFKCHWFDPKDTRRTHEHVGLVEIKQKNRLNVAEVYIVAQQATQVFYLPWACQSVKNLEDWYVVYDVPPHGKLPAPNEEEDYQPHIDPDTYDGEFFQETRVAKKHFGKTSTFGQNMEVENDNAEEEEEVEDEEVTDDDEEEDEEVEHEEVTDADDLSLLDRLQKGFRNVVDAEPDPGEEIIHDDTRDSDDDVFIDPGEDTDDPDY
jgi:hypothetical protein